MPSLSVSNPGTDRSGYTGYHGTDYRCRGCDRSFGRGAFLYDGTGDQKTGNAYKDDFRIRTVQNRRRFAQRISFPGEVMDAGSCSWFVSKNKI